MIYFTGTIELITSLNPCPEQHISITFIKYLFFSSFYFRLKRYAVWYIQASSLYSFQAALKDFTLEISINAFILLNFLQNVISITTVNSLMLNFYYFL